MKKQLFTTLILVFLCTNFLAQKNKKSKEKIKAFKVSYLTQELNLTSEIAEKFWPVYNKHQENLDTLRSKGIVKIRKRIRSAGGFDAFTEEASKSFVISKIILDKKILIEKEKFLTNVSKILSYKKILKLQISEREFTRKLMQRYRDNRPRK